MRARSGPAERTFALQRPVPRDERRLLEHVRETYARSVAGVRHEARPRSGSKRGQLEEACCLLTRWQRMPYPRYMSAMRTTNRRLQVTSRSAAPGLLLPLLASIQLGLAIELVVALDPSEVVLKPGLRRRCGHGETSRVLRLGCTSRFHAVAGAANVSRSWGTFVFDIYDRAKSAS